MVEPLYFLTDDALVSLHFWHMRNLWNQERILLVIYLQDNAEKVDQVTCKEAIWESWFGKLYAGSTGKKTVTHLIACKDSHFFQLMEENLERASSIIGWLQDSKNRVQNATYSFHCYSTR